MLIDLHVHSHLSKDCNLDPKAVLDRAAAQGLDGVAFTETNTQDGCDELFDLAPRSKVKIFVGLELITDKGPYLCFFPKPQLAPEPVQLWGSNHEKPWSAAECLPKVKSLGAVIVAARPYDKEQPYSGGDFILSLAGCLSAVEGYNPRVRPLANEQAVEAAEKLSLPCIGGSDTRASLDDLGRAATLFKQPPQTQEQLVQALSGNAYWPVMMGELPKLSRPGEAREAEKKGKKRRGAKGGRRF